LVQISAPNLLQKSIETLNETLLPKSTSFIIKNPNKNNKYICKIRDLMILLMHNQG